MAGSSKKRKAIASSVVSIVVVLSLTIMPGLASAYSTQDGYTAGQPAKATEIPEWAVDDGQNMQSDGLVAQSILPDAYDLRSDDLVTSVKFQNPWGSCWAFGGTAAAEISLLSAYGATYEKSQLDLSERHLTYFALQPVTEAVDSAQVGEGMYTFDESPNAAYDAGGVPIFITTLFSQGVGPVMESLFPYRGVGDDGKSHTSLEYLNAHPDEVVKDQIAVEAKQYHMTYDEYLEFLETRSGKTEDQVFELYKEALTTSYENNPTYTKFDDWSIPETNESGQSNRLISNGVVLKNGNVLPEYWDKATSTVNEASKEAIKQELLNGRGVSIKFFISQDAKYAASDDGVMYNQYIYDMKAVNHGVCIVGWDDGYSASNFATTAPGDGAWIVKNSWGSETDWSTDDLKNVINKGKFGVKNAEGLSTGYFYLSYFDTTIAQPETMEFTANLGSGGGFYALQHDYMPAYGGFYSTQATSDVTSSANMYDVDKNIVLKSVSTRTSEANMRVTFAVYKLHDGAKDPADGEMVYRTSQNFEYGGFHRLDLDRPITIEAGQKFSVVSTVSKLNDDGERAYSVSANQGISKETAEAMKTPERDVKSYSKAVVNEGESFLYANGEWQDWGEYIASLPPDHSEGLPGDRYIDQFPIDNFSIKVYAESEVPTAVDMYRLYNPNSGEHFYTASAYERDVLVQEGWNYEGIGWIAPSTGEPVYRLYNPNAGDHHYTASAYEKDSLVKVGWNYEGVGWLTAGADGVPLYRQYNPNAEAGAHNYTTSEYENDELVKAGWQAEGIGWYGLG